MVSVFGVTERHYSVQPTMPLLSSGVKMLMIARHGQRGVKILMLVACRECDEEMRQLLELGNGSASPWKPQAAGFVLAVW